MPDPNLEKPPTDQLSLEHPEPCLFTSGGSQWRPRALIGTLAANGGNQ